MILRRKPSSDEREFSDIIDTHVAQKCDGPFPAGGWDYMFEKLPNGRWGFTNPKPRTSLAFNAQLGQEGGTRFSDVRIDIDWNDVVKCIERFADKGEKQAIRLLKLIRNPT
jgi:hypothetical protein